MKKLLSFLLVLVMLFSLASCTGDETDDKNNTTAPTAPTESATEEVDYSKVIDIYIIAGQSNAVGCTAANFNQLYTDAPKLSVGVPNVHYAGNSRDGVETLINRELKWQLTKAGFGRTANHIGPEAGMAIALSEFYNKETGRNAGIIKFAHGGTSIRNITNGMNTHGNWVSPSYAAELKVAFKGATGGLYRGLLDQVERNISELEEYGGFTTVNIKGLYWMQGESDRNATTDYKKSFPLLVNDLRKDISEIMLEFTGGESDCGASEMKIFIGSISNGYCIENKRTEVALNKPFIKMQKNFLETIENCVFVDNTEYAITKWDDATNKVIVLGSDQHHWNSKDMFEIGKNVGKLMIENCAEK